MCTGFEESVTDIPSRDLVPPLNQLGWMRRNGQFLWFETLECVIQAPAINPNYCPTRDGDHREAGSETPRRKCYKDRVKAGGILSIGFTSHTFCILWPILYCQRNERRGQLSFPCLLSKLTTENQTYTSLVSSVISRQVNTLGWFGCW